MVRNFSIKKGSNPEQTRSQLGCNQGTVRSPWLSMNTQSLMLLGIHGLAKANSLAKASGKGSSNYWATYKPLSSYWAKGVQDVLQTTNFLGLTRWPLYTYENLKKSLSRPLTALQHGTYLLCIEFKHVSDHTWIIPLLTCLREKSGPLTIAETIRSKLHWRTSTDRTNKKSHYHNLINNYEVQQKIHHKNGLLFWCCLRFNKQVRENTTDESHNSLHT